MTRRGDRPREDEVRQALHEVVHDAARGGRAVSVLAVAAQVGLSNTTFRRNFPDLAREISERRRTPSQITSEAARPGQQATLADKNARLRQDNARLREHLELAIANIQRLTLENHRLRRQLEDATAVTRIDRAGPHPPPRQNL
jgi:AcrR family transcriptional regulator